jgi:uncharacterized membrane protein YozB (DUF420 family)
METPDVTLVQKLVAGVVLFVPTVATLLLAFGVNITPEQIGAITGVIAGLGGLYVLADAITAVDNLYEEVRGLKRAIWGAAFSVLAGVIIYLFKESSSAQTTAQRVYESLPL